ncbi:hypothetical protein EGW08_020570, partial [Elysia chlorotica]
MNTDFTGWWKKGFLQLFWTNEAWVSTESNVTQALQSLVNSVQSYEAGVCDREVMLNIKKLVSVMFQRLPVVLQERVVLCYLKNHHQEKCIHKVKGGGAQLLPSLMDEEGLLGELTFILNRLTLENAQLQTSYLLFLCLFHTPTVMSHLVHAALSSNAQTEAVIKVLRSMPLVCQFSELETKCCHLVSTISNMIGQMEVNGKQVQIIANFLYSVAEPYLIKSVDATNTQEVEIDGVLPLTNVLRCFIFPCLDSKTSPSDPLRSRILESEDAGFQGMSPVDEASQAPQGESPNVDVGLATLELLLKRTVEQKKAVDFAKFQPIPLAVALSDCYCHNFTLLVSVGGDRGSQLQVCPDRKSRRLASGRCLTLLLQLVKSAWDLFSAEEKTWLYQTVRERSWLHAALLAPALIDCVGWSTMYKTGLSDLCESIKAAPEVSTRRCLYLVQLAVVNDTMFQAVCQELQAQRDWAVSTGCLLVALKWIFLTAVTEEMDYAAQVVKLLLSRSFKDQGDTLEATGPSKFDESSPNVILC